MATSIAPVPPLTPQAADVVAYEHTPYPAMTHPMTHPDRLAVMARLAGVAAADVTTARVLDIGCANGLNLLGLAAAYPQARFIGIDLVADAVERGRSLARQAGLSNVELRVADFADPAALAGEFDYVIAHGVLAWVTPALGEALFALIARHLAPAGVAYVSFNALPGSYARLALRDAMLHATDPAAPAAARLRQARAMLEQIGAERPGDDAVQSSVRACARHTLRRPDGVIEHDELTRHFTPRHLGDVVAQARAHGLDWLGDTRTNQLCDGFLAAGTPAAVADPGAVVIEAAQRRDFLDIQPFRAAAFVNASARRRWTCNLAAVESFYASSGADEVERGRFEHQGKSLRLPDDRVAAALRALIAVYPRRLAVASLDLDPERLAMLFTLFDLGVVTLHSTAERFVLPTGGVPVVSPLVRAMLRNGEARVPTLDHGMLVPTAEARAILLALDGSGRSPALQAAVAEAGFSGDSALDEAYAAVAGLAVLVR